MVPGDTRRKCTVIYQLPLNINKYQTFSKLIINWSIYSFWCQSIVKCFKSCAHLYFKYFNKLCWFAVNVWTISNKQFTTHSAPPFIPTGSTGCFQKTDKWYHCSMQVFDMREGEACNRNQRCTFHFGQRHRILVTDWGQNVLSTLLLIVTSSYSITWSQHPESPSHSEK